MTQVRTGRGRPDCGERRTGSAISRNPYVQLLRTPGALAFSAAGFVGRMSMAMYGLGTVLLIALNTGQYGLAGTVAAAGSVRLRMSIHMAPDAGLTKFAWARGRYALDGLLQKSGPPYGGIRQRAACLDPTRTMCAGQLSCTSQEKGTSFRTRPDRNGRYGLS